MKLCYGRDEDLIHRNFKEIAKRVEIVHRGKAFAALPLVNGLGLFKAEEALKITDRQAAFQTQTSDVVSGRCYINDRKDFCVHGDRLHITISVGAEYCIITDTESTVKASRQIVMKMKHWRGGLA